MRLPWPPREYVRTCGECGTSWRVPARAARRRFRSVSFFDVAPHGVTSSSRRNLARAVASIEAGNQVSQTTRQCPKCGCETFTQRAARG
jgi:hypothetical protein